MLKIYNELLNKIRTTRDYIVKLETLMGCMSIDLEENKIDIKVRDIVKKCVDDINKIYINHECAVNTEEVINEPKLTDDYRSCNDEYKAKLNEENKIDIKVYRSDNLDEKSSK